MYIVWESISYVQLEQSLIYSKNLYNQQWTERNELLDPSQQRGNLSTAADKSCTHNSEEKDVNLEQREWQNIYA
jgi:hypothetical protein